MMIDLEFEQQFPIDQLTAREYNVYLLIKGSDLSSRVQQERVDAILHANWTKSIGTGTYNKAIWQGLERLIWNG